MLLVIICLCPVSMSIISTSIVSTSIVSTSIVCISARCLIKDTIRNILMKCLMPATEKMPILPVVIMSANCRKFKYFLSFFSLFLSRVVSSTVDCLFLALQIHCIFHPQSEFIHNIFHRVY